MNWGDATQMALPFNPEYGLIAVFCVVLVQQLGAPLPLLPVMLLAGAFGFRLPSFLFFNAVGAVLWAGAGLILGLFFYAEIDSLLGQFVAFGGHALAALALLVVTYAAYRWIVRRRFLKSLQASRI